MVQTVPSHTKKISSGVPGFNLLVGGGIPAGTSVLVQAPPGTEKDLFGNQFIKEGLINGDATVMVLSMFSPEEYIKDLRNLGITPSEYITSKRLRILDWYSWKSERIVGIKQFEMGLKTSRDLTNVSIALTKLISDLDNTTVKRAVVTLLSAAMNIFPQDVVFEFAQKLRAKFQKTNITAIFMIDKDAHTPEVISTFQQIFDGVIDIEVKRENDDLVRKIGVLAMAGTAVEPKYKPLKVGKYEVEVLDEDGSAPHDVDTQGEDAEKADDPKFFSVALALAPGMTHPSQQAQHAQKPIVHSGPIVFEMPKSEEKAQPAPETKTDDVKPEEKPYASKIDAKKEERKEKLESVAPKSIFTELLKDSKAGIGKDNEEKSFTIEDSRHIYDDRARSILEAERADEIKKEREMQKYGTTEVSQSVERTVEAHNQAIASMTSARWEISNAKKQNLDTTAAEDKLDKAQHALDERDYERAKMLAMDAEITVRDIKAKLASKEQKKQTQAIMTGRAMPTCPSCGKIVNKAWKMCFFCKSKL